MKEQEKVRKKPLGFWKLGALLLALFVLSSAGHLHQERLLAEARAEYDAASTALYSAHQTGTGTPEDLARLTAAHERYWAIHREQSGRGSSARMATKIMYISGIGSFLWVLTLVGRGFVRAAKWSVGRKEAREQEKDPWE